MLKTRFKWGIRVFGLYRGMVFIVRRCFDHGFLLKLAAQVVKIQFSFISSQWRICTSFLRVL